MFDLNSRDSLEWGLILKEIEKRASSEIGKVYCKNLPLAKSLEEALKFQNQVSEAIFLLDNEGKVPLGGIRNIKQYLNNLAIGGILTGLEFLEVASTLRATRILKKFISSKLSEDSEIYQLVFPLYSNQDLENEIEYSFASDGSVLDTASPALGRIRDSIRQTQLNLRERLNKLIQEPKYKNIIQENIITQRNGRYVVPVKTELQSQLKGIVLDQSQSGATVYIEPLLVVDENNKLTKKLIDERNEIERILLELGNKLIPDIHLFSNTLDILAIVDSIVAKAEYCKFLKAKKVHINNTGFIDLQKVRHPALIAQKSYEEVIPVDIRLGKIYDSLIITGSNTGGKTVTLKTLGLCALMIKVGLYLPTGSESDISFFENILADIGDEQSLEQNLSTFSGHLTNITRIIESANENSLILLDEIGTGTDPTEGAAIAQSIIESLINKGAKTVVTTHFGELKTMAFENANISNASVEFNIETLSPTYKLLLGVPGKSNALHIAKRLGIKDDIIERAKELIKGDEKEVHASIEKLEKEYLELTDEKSKYEELTETLKNKEQEVNEKLHILDNKKQQIREQIFSKFEGEIGNYLEEVREIIRELQRDKTSQHANLAKSKIEKISKSLKDKYRNDLTPETPKTLVTNISEGDYLYLPKLRDVVHVISSPDKDGKVEVQAGNLKVNVNIKELEPVKDKDLKQKVRRLKNTNKVIKVNKVKKKVREEEGYRNSFNECDLRGLFAEDAIMKMEEFLDASYLQSVSPVYIIHGKGTGVLRNAVRDYLSKATYKSTFRPGEIHEGGEGITVVYISK